MISPKAEIDPQAKIGKNVTIYPFAYIEGDVEIGDNCVIYPHVSILNGTRMGKNNKVFPNAVIAAIPQDFHYTGEDSHLVIGDNNTIRENVVMNRATHSDGQTRIGNHNVLMEGVHISHDTKVGDHCVFGYGAKIAGDCIFEDMIICSSGAMIHAGSRIGKLSMITGGCRISKDVPPYIIAGDNPVRYNGINAAILTARHISYKAQGHIANAYRLVFLGQTSVIDGIKQIEDQVPDGPEVRHIVEFLRGTKLGIICKV